MDNLYKHLESLWIIAVLVSVCNCSFPLQYQDSILPTGDRSLQIHGQQPGSNRRIRVICPDFVTIGVQHTLLVDVDINIINVTSRITPTNRSCLTIHRKLYTRISQGSHNFMSFTIWPSMNLYDVQTLDLSLITNNTIIYKKTLDIKYPSIYLWTSQQQFTKPDKLLLWIYSHTDTHRPVPDVNVTVTLTKADSSNDIIEKRNVTTSATGLVQLEFDSKELEVGKYSLAASHTHQTSAVSSTTVFLQPRPAVKRELKIDISTAGYHRHSRSINIKVQVWRPGVQEFEGRIHLLGGVEYIPAEIDETVAETVHSLNISAIIIESKTGIIETIARDLDIYPHKIEVDTSNAPVQYSPGATLHIPFMVLQGQSAARHQCMLVDIITSTGILSSRRLFTDGNGEVNVHWSVSQDISGDIHIEVTDCERSQPNVISHTLTQRQQQEAESIQLYTRKYRYSVDDVMLINSFSHLHLLDILVYQCEGRILGVLHLSNHSTLNVKVTADMFPCIKLVGLEHSANLDTDNSVLLNSSLTIFIDNPNIYQINADKAKYRPGDNVVLQISSPVNQSDIRPQLAADNTFILLASPETSLINIPKIQPKINIAYRLSSTTSSFGVEVVSLCSPNLHFDNDPNKLNLVTIATVSSTSSIVVGRRPTTPTSISQNRIRHAEGRFSKS
ncbi:hypothetical protein EB796_003926 [Bugula neritina]|uniref:PO210 n=1 Tax=Bugula neritina TaxID=10212 RepID=A0A7J7KGH2_BUGNE|nr:hypothetical protein EB796_003926 [Bugula neritina]